MNQQIEPMIISIVGTILASLLGVWMGFLLSRRSAAFDRRKLARIELRKLAHQARTNGATHLVKIYELSRPHVLEIKFSLIEDLDFWKRTKLTSLCDDFLNLPQSEFITRTGQGSDDERKAEWNRQKKEFSARLDTLADAL